MVIRRYQRCYISNLRHKYQMMWSLHRLRAIKHNNKGNHFSTGPTSSSRHSKKSKIICLQLRTRLIEIRIRTYWCLTNMNSTSNQDELVRVGFKYFWKYLSRSTMKISTKCDFFTDQGNKIS